MTVGAQRLKVHVLVVVVVAIDVMHIDSNHGEAAVRETTRFAPRIPMGGVLVFDDLHWPGGAVERAHDLAVHLGFVDLYPLVSGVVMQRQGLGA